MLLICPFIPFYVIVFAENIVVVDEFAENGVKEITKLCYKTIPGHLCGDKSSH